jgi:hypothetical protein
VSGVVWPATLRRQRGVRVGTMAKRVTMCDSNEATRPRVTCGTIRRTLGVRQAMEVDALYAGEADEES